MKYLLLIILIVFANIVNAQQRYIVEKTKQDTVTIRIQDELIYMRSQLRLSQSYFNGAISCYVVSGLAQAAYFGLEKNKTFLYASIGLSSLGTILLIVSHSYIGKAGVGIGGDGVTVRYVF